MDTELERVIEIVAEETDLNKKDIKRLKKEVSYLENAVLDIINNYPDGKVDKASLLVYLAYLLGKIIDSDYEFAFFFAIMKAIYDRKNMDELSL